MLPTSHAGHSRCHVETELHIKARWTVKQVLASRVQSARPGASADAIADGVLLSILQGRLGDPERPGALGFLSLDDVACEEAERRIVSRLADDAVRQFEIRTRFTALRTLRSLHDRAASSGVAWHDLRLRSQTRCVEAATDRTRSTQPFGRWFVSRGSRIERHSAYVSLRIGLTLSGERPEIERTLERDRVALERLGDFAWTAPVFEERRTRRRDLQDNAAPGAARLPPAGARLISLLREVACCLLAEDEGASFTVARALAIFAQSQPDITRLFMRDPRSACLDDGIAADEPADVDFEIQKSLRTLQHRHDFAGLRDLFCELEPRMGLLRLIEHRIRSEAEGRASPFHAAAFARVFGEAANAALHLRAMEADGLLPPPRLPASVGQEAGLELVD